MPLPSPNNEFKQTPPSGRIIPFLLCALIAVQILTVCIMAGVPPVCRDSLSHHLAVPKIYLRHGGMVELPDIGFSYYPMNVDLLYTIPLFFGNDIAPKYIHFLFALLTAWVIYRYLKRPLGSTYSLLAVLWFLSLPIIVKLSISVYVDLGLIFFSTAALIFLFRWMEEPHAVRYLAASAVFCGLALGTKYNALIVFLLLALMTPFLYARTMETGGKASLQALKYSLIFIVLTLLVFSPWMIRNYAWKKNPVYPLLKNVFQKQNPPPADGNAVQDKSPVQKGSGPLNHFALRHILFEESGFQIVLIPLRIFFQGQDDNPRYFDGRLNPLLFFLPFCAFLPTVRKFGNATNSFMLLAFSWLFLIIAFFQIDMRIRYILPIVPPLIILSAFGLRTLFESADRIKKPACKKVFQTVLTAMVGLSLWYNIDYQIDLFRHVDPLSYIGGKLDRDGYIEKFRPEYPVYRHINANLPKDAKILGLFIGNRIYYSDREMVSNEYLFRRIVREADSPRRMVEGLARNSISHLMVRHDVFSNWANRNFDARQRAMINSFFSQQLDKLIFKGGVGLYRIVREDSAASPPSAVLPVKPAP